MLNWSESDGVDDFIGVGCPMGGLGAHEFSGHTGVYQNRETSQFDPEREEGKQTSRPIGSGSPYLSAYPYWYSNSSPICLPSTTRQAALV